MRAQQGIIVEKMHQYFIIPNRPNLESASIAELQSSFSRRALLNLSRIVSREVKLQGVDIRSGFAAIPPLRIVSNRNDAGENLRVKRNASQRPIIGLSSWLRRNLVHSISIVEGGRYRCGLGESSRRSRGVSWRS